MKDSEYGKKAESISSTKLFVHSYSVDGASSAGIKLDAGVCFRSKSSSCPHFPCFRWYQQAVLECIHSVPFQMKIRLLPEASEKRRSRSLPHVL